MVVEVLVFPLGQFDDPLDRLIFDLSFTRPSSVAVNHSLGAALLDPRFDPVTLPLAHSHHQCCLDHRQFTLKYSIYDLYPLLVSHCQGCHPLTLTYSRCR